MNVQEFGEQLSNEFHKQSSLTERLSPTAYVKWLEAKLYEYMHPEIEPKFKKFKKRYL